MSDLVRTSRDGHVAIVEMNRPPANFFDRELLALVGDAVLACDSDPDFRAIVLCSNGKHFCAGADLRGMDVHGIREVYRQASRLFNGRKPIVAAVQGAAVGGGLGLAMAADFRVVAADARLTANFAKLGFHQGFALSVTLPRAVGWQTAQDLLYTGRDVSGTDAHRIGLADRVVDGDPREAALEYARELAHAAPLAVPLIRATLRRSILGEVAVALDLEASAQGALLDTADFAEGIAAAIGKRPARFQGA
jgi:enoyl-CoA hydratase/carnithine racemase